MVLEAAVVVVVAPASGGPVVSRSNPLGCRLFRSRFGNSKAENYVAFDGDALERSFRRSHLICSTGSEADCLTGWCVDWRF
uniref:Putative secreted protein n=1 Tax=Ixodes ricinus TaxID=34613 RepID=A0A6B0U6P4_IXORI